MLYISYISNKPHKIKVYVRWGTRDRKLRTCSNTESCITSKRTKCYR